MHLTLKGIFATLTVFATGLVYTQPTSQPGAEPECFASWAPDLKGQACIDEVARMKAQQKPNLIALSKEDVCTYKGLSYKLAAEERDATFAPQQTYQVLSKMYLHPPEITEKTLKNLINQVYFDSGFVNAGGEALLIQVRNLCLYPKGKF